MSARGESCVGALIGTFVGDALGMPVEGWSAERIRAERGRVDEMLPARMGRGTYTDDTQLMIALAESILETGGIDEEAMAQRILDLHDPDRGYGRGTTRVLMQWREGVPVDEAAGRIFDGGSFGNGGAMRVASVAAAYHDDLDALRRAARRSCEITHAHPIGFTGAQIQARAIAEAIRASSSDAIQPRAFLDRLRRGYDGDAVPGGVWEVRFRTLHKLLGEPEQPVDPTVAAEELGNDSRVHASVPAAVYAALANRESFEEAVVYAVSVGGDTDTIGAMAGAIAGGLHGVDAVPDRWWEALEDATRGRDHVVELGERLAAFAEGRT